MSNVLEHIDKAIGAHGKWKIKLRQSIDGTLTLDPVEVSMDNQCEFGKWLYSFSGAQTSDPHYTEVRALHKAFHKAAGEVVSNVLKGDKAAALASIGLSGEYAAASSKLTVKMMEWKRLAAKAA
jgi:hypothetical protein